MLIPDESGRFRRREFLNPDTTHVTRHQQSGTAARNVLRGEWAAGVIAAPKGTQGNTRTFGPRGESEQVPSTPSTGRSWLGTLVNSPEVEFWACNAMESPPRSGAKQGPVTHRMTISKPSCRKWRSLVRTSEIRWRRIVVMDMQSTRL